MSSFEITIVQSAAVFSPQKHEGQLSVMQLMDMLTGVASGMKYLTEMGFVHKRLAAHKVGRSVGVVRFARDGDLDLNLIYV